MLIMRCELKIPSQLARAPAQCYHAVRKKIVAGASVTGKYRRRIANTPIQKIKRPIIAPGDPSRASPCSPCIVLPCLVAALAGSRDRVKLPLLLAGHCVVRSEKPSNTVLASGYTNDDRLVHNQRCSSHRETIGWICHLGLPDHLSIVCVNRYQVPIQSAEKERVAKNGEPSIYCTTTNW